MNDEGDEFVGIVNDTDSEAFHKCMTALKKAINENDRIAAIGYADGPGNNIKELVKSAEKMMYEDKERYYKETGKERRH